MINDYFLYVFFFQSAILFRVQSRVFFFFIRYDHMDRRERGLDIFPGSNNIVSDDHTPHMFVVCAIRTLYCLEVGPRSGNDRAFVLDHSLGK